MRTEPARQAPVPTLAVDPPDDLHLQHLIAALGRIDLLLQTAVQRWRLAGQDPNDDFRGLYVSDTLADTLLARPFGASWGDGVELAPEAQAGYSQALAACAAHTERIAQEIRRQGSAARLSRLAELFALEDFEQDALLICLAPALDLRYERIYGYLQDDVTRRSPSANLILSLLCAPGPARLARLVYFGEDAPLLRHHLLEPVTEAGAGKPVLLNQAFRVDDSLVAWLLGSCRLHARIRTQAALVGAVAAVEDLRTDTLPSAADEGAAWNSAAWTALEEGLRRQPNLLARALLVFTGPDQAAQDAAARRLAARLKRPLLMLDMAAAAAGEEPLLPVVVLAARDARLHGALLHLHGFDACLSDGSPPAGLLAALGAQAEPVGGILLSGQAAWLPRGAPPEMRFHFVEFVRPSYPQRLALWQHFLPEREDAPQMEAGQTLSIEALAAHFQLTSGQIRDAAAAARSLAAQHGRAVSSGDLFAAARAHSNPRLSSLANKIEPRYTWQDIILPADQRAMLTEIILTVRQRPRVLEDWGVGEKLVSSRGVTVLFAGPPGTGKTMAAEIIAGTLGLDLFKIDLSSIISKYIGETEKNLERIFSEASSSNAILFFDEADALFGKRSEVRDSHDRYANIEISYLLQRMEAYDGITILATNLRANLDEAFTRRLQFSVDFPFPEEEDRLRIWQSLFPSGVPRAPDLDFALLAQRFKLAGGNIRNILVSAAYLAAADGGQVTMSHLLHGARRELQKMGKLLGAEDQFSEQGAVEQ